MASAEGRTCVDIRIKLSVKETKQLNRNARQFLEEQTKVDKKRSATRGANSDCSPYASGNRPSRAIGHFGVPEKTVKRFMLDGHL